MNEGSIGTNGIFTYTLNIYHKLLNDILDFEL